MNIEEKIKKIICDIANIDVSDEDNLKDKNLIEDLKYDSIMLVRMMVEMEKEFVVEFDDEEIELEILSNYNKIVILISKKIENIRINE